MQKVKVLRLQTAQNMRKELRELKGDVLSTPLSPSGPKLDFFAKEAKVWVVTE